MPVWPTVTDDSGDGLTGTIYNKALTDAMKAYIDTGVSTVKFDKVGIGTTGVPHGGVGSAILALEGEDSTTGAPIAQFTTTGDNYPLLQIFPYSHDEIAFLFDSYYSTTGSSWLSSDSGSNFRIAKGCSTGATDLFTIDYDSNIAKAAAITWNIGFQMTNAGVITIPGNVNFGEYLYHDGDVDTYVRFEDDRVHIYAGNVDMLDIIEAGTDKVTWNEGGADVDFEWEASGVDPAFFIQGSDGGVGIGTGAVPHGGVGSALVAIEGSDGTTGAPIVQFTTTGDNYPLLQILPYAHDEIALCFDCYYSTTGGNWLSSDSGSNFRIAKGCSTGATDLFTIDYDSNIAKAGAITWNTGITLTAVGKVGVGTITPSVNADLTLEGGAICLKEITTPTDDAGYGKLYCKADNKVYFQTGAGAELELGTTTLTGIDDNAGSVTITLDPNGRVGIGTTGIPHGAVGSALFALEGADATTGAPIVQFTTTGDNYPLLQIFPYSHDEIAICFDSYYSTTGSNWLSSDSGSNFRIAKGCSTGATDLFTIDYDSNIAKAAAITWNTGIQLDVSGNVTIPQNLLISTLAIDKIITTTTSGQLTDANVVRFDNLGRNTAFASRSQGTAAEPDEWVLEGTPTVAYDTVDVGYGDFAVKLTATGAANEGIKQTWTHLKPSTKYQIFSRAKATGGNSDTARLLTTGATTNIDTETTSTSWTSLIGEFITDGSGTDVVTKLLAKADGDIIWFCGITCVEGDIPPGNFIRRVNETIRLKVPMHDTSWDSDGYSTSEADIDLSAFGNGCPPKIKAVYVSFTIRDEASATGAASLMLGIGGIALGTTANMMVGKDLKGKGNDELGYGQGWVHCDSNGDIRYDIVASGANTLDVWLNIWGYVLGE